MARARAASAIIQRLREVIDEPVTELEHRDPYELLVAVILSAQCTDERVNLVTPALFEQYPDVQALSKAAPADIFPFIQSITFPNNKSRHLAGMARMVVADFAGEIPSTVAELQKLPGAGRKTALVVAGAAFGASAMAVDTHVFRVAHRLGLVRRASHTPDAVEADLRRIVPREDLSEAHHLFILHGRYTCTARSPKCGTCVLADLCPQWQALQRLPEPRTELNTSRARYWCGTRGHYVDHTVPREDRSGVRQESCPRCGSFNLFDTKTGRTLRRVFDARIGDMAYGRPDDRTHAA
ncbi:MAG: endonuclease III [Rhodothermales bacterium]|nr:endonuclease III [Rhodothermales bacterium]MBO6780743.1 endonuclease III [Rhodothermales bacterium]